MKQQYLVVKCGGRYIDETAWDSYITIDELKIAEAHKYGYTVYTFPQLQLVEDVSILIKI